MEDFYNSLEPYDLSNLQYVGRDRTFPPGDKRGPPRALNPMNEFFLTLVRLRLGLQERDLADRFGISQGTVSVMAESTSPPPISAEILAFSGCSEEAHAQGVIYFSIQQYPSYH